MSVRLCLIPLFAAGFVAGACNAHGGARHGAGLSVEQLHSPGYVQRTSNGVWSVEWISPTAGLFTVIAVIRPADIVNAQVEARIDRKALFRQALPDERPSTWTGHTQLDKGLHTLEIETFAQNVPDPAFDVESVVVLSPPGSPTVDFVRRLPPAPPPKEKTPEEEPPPSEPTQPAVEPPPEPALETAAATNAFQAVTPESATAPASNAPPDEVSSTSEPEEDEEDDWDDPIEW